ncbi:hypothetical protein DMB66_56490, partial [Actinoplanes sp. ATCC 53533]
MWRRRSNLLSWLPACIPARSTSPLKPRAGAAGQRRLGRRGGGLLHPYVRGCSKGFVGGTADPGGLTHLGAREYDAGIGRFISVDPIQDMTDPQQWNGYSYSNSSPVTFADPTGTRMDPDEPGCTPGPGGTCGTPSTSKNRPPTGGNATASLSLTRELGPSTNGGGSTSAHDTAIALRVLDLQRLYKGAWISVSLGNAPGADLVCWNCAAIAS